MSVSKIVKSLNKTVKKLEAHAASMETAININDAKIAELNRANILNGAEAGKAQRIAGKLKALLS